MRGVSGHEATLRLWKRRFRRCKRASGTKGRGRNAGLAVDVRDPHRELVHVAPGPVLARLDGADERVVVALRVGARVAVRRRVAAAHMAAGQADPQVTPLAAGLEALLAAGDLRGELGDFDAVE